MMLDNLAMQPNQLTVVDAITGAALTWALGYWSGMLLIKYGIDML